MGDWRDDRIGSARRGENPMVMARMRSGFAVIGDTQHLPGYSLLLTDDPTADQLTDLDWGRRNTFLFDLSLLGEAVGRACQESGLRRINYEVLGNSLPVLHGHVHARYEWEPADKVGGPVWHYPTELRNDQRYAFSEEKHGELRAAITVELEALIRRSYQPADRLAGPVTPRLQTPRLVMREWRESDLDAHAAMSADPEVQRHLEGVLDRAQSWRSMALSSGHWALRGYGSWVVERKSDGVVLGRVGLWNPEGWFGVEVGWKLARHAWGEGYATEAAAAAITWAFANLDLDQVISVVNPENTASIRVAQRLGMTKSHDADLHRQPVTIMALNRAAWSPAL